MPTKPIEFTSLSEAHKSLPDRLKILKLQEPKLEIRSICFHRVDPETGGNWHINIRGHIKTKDGVREWNG